MTYEIKWLNQEHTRAKITKKSRFRPDRVAIVVLANIVTDASCRWNWEHEGTDISVCGEKMKVYIASGGGTSGGTEAQAALSKERYNWLCGDGDNEHCLVVPRARLLAPWYKRLLWRFFAWLS